MIPIELKFLSLCYFEVNEMHEKMEEMVPKIINI